MLFLRWAIPAIFSCMILLIGRKKTMYLLDRQRIRSSLIGSLLLGITGIDPLKYGLLFERFLNPDRISNPDFDIDFCKDGRDKVIDYVTQKYGKDAVAQICTFGTMAQSCS